MNTDKSSTSATKVVLTVTACAACAGISWAQVMRPTQAEKETAPVQFRAEVTGDSKFQNYERKTTPPGVYPTTGPRDFSGAYTRAVTANTGGMAAGPAGGAGMGGAAPAAGGMSAGGLGSGKPGDICVPTFNSGFQGGYPTHIHMTADQVTIIQEENHRMRRIYIGSEHQKNGEATYSGDSIAHWDGDTLVVETINRKGQNGTMVERIRKIDGGRSLENVTTVNGQSSTNVMAWRPDVDYVEDICEDFGEAFGEGYL